MTKSSRALVLINPLAGKGRAESVYETAARKGNLEGVETIVASEAGAAAREVTAKLRDGKFDRLIAIGGDGTGRLGAQVLIEASLTERVAFGLVPAGTGSDFVRYLDPKTPPAQRLAELLETDHTVRCDVTEASTASGRRLFSLNVASAGLSSAVNEKMNASERHGGKSYLLLTLSALIGYEPYFCRVEADGETLFDGPIFLVAVANARFFGKGMKVAPEALIDDGRLDVLVVPPIPRWQLPVRLPRFLKGLHLDYEEVIHRQASEVRFEPAPGLPSYDLDGDSQPAETVTFRCLPGKLRLLASRAEQS